MLSQILILALSACAPDPAAADAAGADADADSDADSDTDADADTDADSDADADQDGDGSTDAEDCAPANAAVYPGAVEVCDGVDQDCDQAVDEAIASTVRDETDRGDDGSIDMVAEWDYDAANLLIASRSDTGNDGIDDVTCAYEYFGTTVSHRECDTNSDAALDFIYDATFDGAGRFVETRTDADGDGDDDETHVYTWAGDGSGQIENDFQGDGVADSITTFDDHQNTISVSEWVEDVMTVVRRTTNTYDGEGNRVLEELDEGDDGSLDYVNASVYNAQNQLVSFESDYGNDGFIDIAGEYVYDGGGHVTWYGVDATGDGEPDQVSTWLYDVYSRLVESTIDSPVGGDAETVIAYTYAEDGLSWTINTLIRGTPTTDAVTKTCD